MKDDNYYKMIYDRFVQEQKDAGIWIDDEDFFDEMNKVIKKVEKIQKKQKPKKELSEEQKKKKEEYFNKLNNYDPFVQKEKPQFTMDYEKAANKVYNYLCSRLRGDVKLSQSDKHVYRKLTKYFIGENDVDFSGDLKKGICLYGDVGTGKSITMEVFSAFTYETPNKFKIYDIKEIAREVQIQGIEVLKEYTKGNCCYDDVGFERNVQHYGSKYDVFEEIVNIMYDKFQKTGRVFHMTTNLGITEDFGHGTINEKYNRRVVDRLREMFNFIELNGESKRK